MTRIAVVGVSCRYPDADSPDRLWENVVAGRRAFRRLPDVRMRLSDYYSPDSAAPDRFYARNAAVIEGYEFDRVGYRVAGSTYRSTDLTHWLALDVAAQALADAGFPMGADLPREKTGVVVGNTLTGEFARANIMRLRWPYVRRTVAAALREEGWSDEQLSTFLGGLEQSYKSPFPAIDEDSLAGGLSNTIAGRICNYFDLKGGGYTVDGACSSSLLSVSTACRALVDGDLDVAIAGGVDLSIDPFEIIGFAKTGALAKGEMKVYDRGSNGFWPGEGCGMVVLMREEDARAQDRKIYAVVAGWGMSSDGKGGITRPEVDGYRLALKRAYAKAGFGIETVGLFEGHGTGTAVGDATELEALTLSRKAADPYGPKAAIGSIKAMIGHTKAAAGIAGLIKAVLAVHHQVLPPTIGCPDPHDFLTGEDPALRVLATAESWPEGVPVRAAVTAMGFGGINTHIVIEGPGEPRRTAMSAPVKSLALSLQDAELLTVDADTIGELRERVQELLAFVPQLSYAQIGDLAATLHRALGGRPYRAAVVASSPEDAERQLQRIDTAIAAGETKLFPADGRALFGRAGDAVRVGLLFPGQGSGRRTGGGALRRRFAEADEVYATAALPTGGDVVATEVAQPRIVTGSMAGLAVLGRLGIHGDVAVGHSLGELTALHWAGAMGRQDLLRIAATRGRTMAEHSASGTMASIGGPAETASTLIGDLPVVIAGYNGPDQTVLAGPVDAIRAVGARAEAAGLTWTLLRVSHAFHSPLVSQAADAFGAYLMTEPFQAVGKRVISTVTAEALTPQTNLAELLHRQILDPVLFVQAVGLAAKEADLFIEVGPGKVLSGLASASVEVPVVALDTDEESIGGLLRVVAAAFVVGAAGVHPSLFEARLSRVLELDAEFSFFASPCEQVSSINIPDAEPKAGPAATGPNREPSTEPALELLRRLAAERAELPLDMVLGESRLLDDLHLSSITVGQVVNQAAQRLGVAPSRLPTSLATATVREVADALDLLAGTGQAADMDRPLLPAGAAPFIRAFAVDLDAAPLPTVVGTESNGIWRVYAAGDHPLAEPLRVALERGKVGTGVLVCLPPECTEAQLELALLGAKAAIAGIAGDRFVVVQQGRGATALAKTLRLELPSVRVTVVDVPMAPEAVAWVVAEVAATTAYQEAHYDVAGGRRVPVVRAMPVTSARTSQPLDPGDVLLVTGGGKGITAECALALATQSGARLALLGRSDPAADPELAANLERFSAAGVDYRYLRADVTSAAAIKAAVSSVTAQLGPVTAVLHGAGRNDPAALTSLDMEAFRGALAPKIDGLAAVLAAVDADRLKLLVTFGSIIGRAGLRGEAHYATANDWMADATARFGAEHPECRAICLEWSVWSGAGMGERLSVVESLEREGITPITLDQGVRLLHRLVGDPDAPSAVVICGRTQGIDTLRHDLPELPLLRFVDKPLIRYHGVELVTDVELTAGSDPYLADHLLDGNLLFPAVLGMEAMTQVASALTGRTDTPVIEGAEFARPVVIPPDGATTIRIAAVVTEDDLVDVVIRSSETGFAADHFRARIRFDLGAPAAGSPEQSGDDLPMVALDPARDLYGDTLFQGARFQRLRGYHRAAARHVDADVAALDARNWFAAYLPGELLLGDPGMRDALMHGNQVCVPEGTLLPIGIERVHPGGARLAAEGELRYCAVERSRDGDTYVYDIAVRTRTGEVVERWDGLQLRAVRKKDGRGPWVAPLLGSYLERSLGDLIGASIAVAVEPDSDDHADCHARSELAVHRALGGQQELQYRTDGQPGIAGDRSVAVSQAVGVTLGVAAVGTLGCHVGPVTPLPAETWDILLSEHSSLLKQIVAERGEEMDTAGSRVDAVLQCLQQLDLPSHLPVTLVPEQKDAWQVFASGTLRIATLMTTLRDVEEQVVFAILTDGWS